MISSDIVHLIADEAGQRLTRGLIRRLQKMAPGFRAGDGAANLWDEICVQTQQDSEWAPAYEEEMERQLRPLISSLSEIERAALWLCIGEGYFFDERNEMDCWDSFLAAVDHHELSRRIIDERMKYQAMNYENAAIRLLTGR